MSIEQLVSISQRYGSDPDFVLLGGGNTSVKKGRVLYVKASGHALGTIEADGFAALDLDALDRIWETEYPADGDAREAAALADLMACRVPGEEKRPSVEALLHAILPFKYVVHMHPALVNGLTCSQNGAEVTAELFPDALWIELVNPGYILAKTVRDQLGPHKERTGSNPAVIFLENHGVFVASEELDEIDRLYEMIMQTLRASLVREVDTSEVSYDEDAAAKIVKELAAITDSAVYFATNAEIARLVTDEDSFGAVASSFTPDHIVYAGFKPLWVESDESVSEAYQRFVDTYGGVPKVVCVQGLGAFSIGERPMPLFHDTVAIAVYSESFGGPKFMNEELIDFIRTWEVEQYRQKVAGS